MSLNVLKEIVIHYHSFCNIDLLNQGLYQIRTKIFYTDRNIKYTAFPYHFSNSKENGSSLLSEENTKYNIISNHIGENSTDYVTKTFAIRYSDEEVDIDEFCYFRIEIPFEKLRSDVKITIEMSLYFSDSYVNLIKDKSKEGNNSLEFKCAGIQTITIASIKKSFIQSYAPIIYADNFSSILKCSVHAINLDYKLRSNNLSLFSNEKKDQKQNTQNQNKENRKASIEKSDSIVDKNFNMNISSTENIGLFLLDNKGNPLPVNLEDDIIDEVYKKYIVSLVQVYATLKSSYFMLLNKLLDDKMKSEFPFFTIIQPLYIYYEEKDKQTIDILNEDIISNSIEYPQEFLNLSQRISEFSIEYISCRILVEINFISSQTYQIWHKYIELIRYFPLEVDYILNNLFHSKYKENLMLYLKKSYLNITEATNLMIPIENNLSDINKNNAVEIRKTNKEILNTGSIDISCFHIKSGTFPVLFEENYIKHSLTIEESKKSFYEKINIDLNNIEKEEGCNSLNESIEMGKLSRHSLHLIVLVHGFQGNCHDMRLIKNTISIINPACILLPSCANQEDTECDLTEMGKRLANEVKAFIKDWNDGSIFNRISFIGHSIGGLIIRASLQFLSEYSNKMWMYISLSSPHMGYIYSNSKLIGAGIWLLKTWKKSLCLEQLSLSDSKDLKECCLYKLSAMDGLNWFSHVFLVSSHQDSYAPYESTRVQLCDQAFTDSHRADIYRSMAYNILTKIMNSNFRRVDVNFYIPEKSFDSLIGRTAHIQFLENTSFMKTLFYSIEHLLK